MANPQVENGYIKIATELVEQLAKTQISGRESRILWAIWRKTWGWGKKSDKMSIGQIVEATEIEDRSNVQKALKSLIKRKLIIKSKGRKKFSMSEYSFNKDYENWRTVVKKDPKKKNKKVGSKMTSSGVKNDPRSGVKNDHKVGSKMTPTIDNINNINTSTIDRAIKGQKIADWKDLKPGEKNRLFFDAMENAINGGGLDELVKELLIHLSETNNSIKKEIIWREMKKFVLFWTERNKSGKKQRWEMEKTFELERRIGTWFRRAKDISDFSTSLEKIKPKGKQFIT